MGQDSGRQLCLSNPLPRAPTAGAQPGTMTTASGAGRPRQRHLSLTLSITRCPGNCRAVTQSQGFPIPPGLAGHTVGAAGMAHHIQSPLTGTPGRVLPSVFPSHPCSSSLSPSLSPFPASLTLLGHSNFEALLEPAVLAPVARHLVDDAVLVPVARVHHVLLDAAAEEALGTPHAPISTRHGDPEHPEDPGEPWGQSVAALTLQPSQALTP